MHACGARGHCLFFCLLQTVPTAEHQGQTELIQKAFIHLVALHVLTEPDNLWRTIIIELSSALLVVVISVHVLDFFYVLVPSVHHG